MRKFYLALHHGIADVVTFTTMMDVTRKKNDYEFVKRLFHYTLDKQIDCPPIYARYIIAAGTLGHLEEATNTFHYARRKEKTDAKLYNAYFDILTWYGEWQQARQLFPEYKQLVPFVSSRFCDNTHTTPQWIIDLRAHSYATTYLFLEELYTRLGFDTQSPIKLITPPHHLRKSSGEKAHHPTAKAIFIFKKHYNMELKEDKPGQYLLSPAIPKAAFTQYSVPSNNEFIPSSFWRPTYCNAHDNSRVSDDSPQFS